jgi:hypothetical protein
MDWGYLELPTDEENVARFTPVVWAKSPVERHRKKAKRRVLESIDLTVDANQSAFGCKSNLSKTQKMAFSDDFCSINFFLNN